MKKILFVVTEMRLGGREKVVGNVADSLSKMYHVRIFSVWKRAPFFKTKTPIIFGNTSKVIKKRRKNSKCFDIAKNKVVFPLVKKIANYSFLQKSRLTDLIDYLKKNDIKVVILTDLTMTFAKRISEEVPSIKIVGWAHMEPNAFFGTQYKDFKKELMEGMGSLNQLVTLSENQKIGFQERCKVQSVYIPNPMPKLNKLSSLNHKIITMVCRIDIKHKGLDLLIRVAKNLPKGWKIEIAGSGKISDEEQFASLIKENKLGDIINWVPALKGNALDEFYSRGSIFLMTSRYEGFPLTIGEAMSHGLPIIAFENDGTNTILDYGNFGILVPLYDFKAMSKAINDLGRDIKKREAASKRSIKRLENFSEEKIAHRWDEILKN